MSGAEALLVVGIIANIVQLVDFTNKVVSRVKDSAQDAHSIPKAFRNIQATLPLLASTLRKTEDQVNTGKLDEQTCNTLRPVVEACEAQMNELKAIFDKALPTEGASRWTRGWKAISSVGKDNKVDHIARCLSELRSTLIHYHVTNLATRDGQHDIATDLNRPFTASTIIAGQNNDARQRELEERCLHSLAFPSMDSRRIGIEEPAMETCSWLFEHPLYQQWDSRNGAATSHGLLWIKGKPGSGKSTLMKRLVERSEERPRQGGICISFFFSARGAGLERSIEGLYRSLTYQLLRERRTLLAQLASLANEKEIRYGRGNWTWHVKEIKEFFHASIAKAGFGPLKVFVDALDECKDDDVQEAVTAFERSAAASIANGTVLDICWSSRHYPHIRVRRSLVICMEHQNAEDIAAYVRNKVKESSLIDHELESEIIEKAKGVFMWVVLVFRQLLDAGDQGYSRAGKKQILEDLPSELDDLFRRILLSVKPRHRQIRTLLFQYAMVAPEPLLLKDMQVALAFSAIPPPQSIRSWRSSESYLEPRTAFPNFIREVSGGLLEISTKKGEERRRVRFIHESVRDFIQSGASCELLDMGGYNDLARQGHQNLRNACLAYLSSQEVLSNLDRLSKFETSKYCNRKAWQTRTKAETAMYGFVDYAASMWPFHARGAEDTGQSQAYLVQMTTKASFHGALRLWVATRGPYRSEHKTTEGISYEEDFRVVLTDGIDIKEVLLWASCVEGIVSCIHPLLLTGVNPFFEIQGHKLAWFAAAESRRSEVVRGLLKNYVPNLPDYPFAGDHSLHRNLWSSGLGIVEVLLEHGFSADSRSDDGETPIQISSFSLCNVSEQIAMIRKLAVHGADIKVLDSVGRTVLHLAVRSNWRPEIVSCLIDAGADIEALDNHGRTLLQLAVGMNCCAEVVSCIIDAGADIEALDGYGRTVLHLAVCISSSPDIVSCLIDAGADIKAVDGDGRTVLHSAAVHSLPRTEIISCLINAGADVKAVDRNSRTALHLAVSTMGKSQRTVEILMGRANTVRNMLKAGADANAQDNDGNASLHLAIGNAFWHPEKSSKSERYYPRNIDQLTIVVHNLILCGANITTKNNDGVTAADLIDGLPDRISREFKSAYIKAALLLREANHDSDTEMSVWMRSLLLEGWRRSKLRELWGEGEYLWRLEEECRWTTGSPVRTHSPNTTLSALALAPANSFADLVRTLEKLDNTLLSTPCQTSTSA